MVFFSQPNVTELINARYERGVRQSIQAMINAIKNSGAGALQRIQSTGSVAYLELSLILRSAGGGGSAWVIGGYLEEERYEKKVLAKRET